MTTKTLQFLLLGSIMLLGACAYTPKTQEAEYWQRTDAPSQIYLRGAKAQHTLNHDVANCTVEIRELTRLGSLRTATPPNTHTPRSDGAPMGGKTAGFDTPQYSGAEYAAYYDYADFEGCMIDKGWRRVDYVPATVETEARRNFVEAVFTPEEKKREYRDQYNYGYDTSGVNYDELNQ